MSFTDAELAQIDRAAERRARDADWMESKPTKNPLWSCHATPLKASKPLEHFKVEAPNKTAAISMVYSAVPPGTFESVCAFEVRGQAKVTLDALSLRISPTPLFDSAFGLLV